MAHENKFRHCYGSRYGDVSPPIGEVRRSAHRSRERAKSQELQRLRGLVRIARAPLSPPATDLVCSFRARRGDAPKPRTLTPLARPFGGGRDDLTNDSNRLRLLALERHEVEQQGVLIEQQTHWCVLARRAVQGRNRFLRERRDRAREYTALTLGPRRKRCRGYLPGRTVEIESQLARLFFQFRHVTPLQRRAREHLQSC